MSMTDKAAEKIAEQTIEKYDKAGRGIIIALCVGKEARVMSNVSDRNTAEVGLDIFTSIMGDETIPYLEAYVKELKAYAKKVAKKEKKDAKRKKRA